MDKKVKPLLPLAWEPFFNWELHRSVILWKPFLAQFYSNSELHLLAALFVQQMLGNFEAITLKGQ